jgi:hypothetical protein
MEQISPLDDTALRYNGQMSGNVIEEFDAIRESLVNNIAFLQNVKLLPRVAE